jgi:hypothetical protein
MIGPGAPLSVWLKRVPQSQIPNSPDAPVEVDNTAAVALSSLFSDAAFFHLRFPYRRGTTMVAETKKGR